MISDASDTERMTSDASTKNTEPMSPDASNTECSSIMKINSLKESLSTDFDDRCNMNEPASVKFTSVEIREFEIIIGDNPSCRAGAPLRCA